MRDIYKGIVNGLNDAIENAEGKRDFRANTVSIEPVRKYDAAEIKKIRNELGMTQAFFACFMGVSQKTIEAWESGRNMPDGPARRILSMVQADPLLPERYNIVMFSDV
ncbi:MAG: helix-turn-helix domain-containing protein [Thermincola sp.]|nr:helix-turn-helix domain-containing protein [Thermincola sp.]MDT3702672.1 helix-turn-helix domain-containing protein [Thermincola sp.]